MTYFYLHRGLLLHLNTLNDTHAQARAHTHTHTHTHTHKLGRTLLDDGSDRRRGLYLATHNTHKRQTSMSMAWFELPIPKSEGPQTHALDRAATRMDGVITKRHKIQIFSALKTSSPADTLHHIMETSLDLNKMKCLEISACKTTLISKYQKKSLI
jgi:ferredoxin-like protein FixX